MSAPASPALRCVLLMSLLPLFSGGCVLVQSSGAAAASAKDTTKDASVGRGRELFTHTWSADDALATGDGLGPLYNETSCAGCHRDGGLGGAGPQAKNVELLVGVEGSEVLHRHALIDDWSLLRQRRIDTAGPTIMIHGIGGELDPDGFVEDTVDFIDEPGQLTQRNTPSLFGLSRIAGIPESAIRANVELPGGRKSAKGRLVRDEEGQLGRFGWKGQVGRLESFVAQACAVELGLGTSKTPQADGEGFEDEKAKPDLSDRQVSDLVAFVSSLPAPKADAAPDAAGWEAFRGMDCDTCHRPDLGEVSGLFSDLRVHDMGPALADPFFADGGGGGYGLRRRRGERVAKANPKHKPAQAAEWRTPPLWGVSRTGPWLHDGRAETLDAAIRTHGGAADDSRGAYEAASKEEQAALLRFLSAI